MDKHASGPGSRVIDRFSRLRFQNTDEQVHDFRRREELTRLGPGVVRELLDEVFVSPPQHVGLHAGIGQVDLSPLCYQRVSHDSVIRTACTFANTVALY